MNTLQEQLPLTFSDQHHDHAIALQRAHAFIDSELISPFLVKEPNWGLRRVLCVQALPKGGVLYAVYKRAHLVNDYWRQRLHSELPAAGTWRVDTTHEWKVHGRLWVRLHADKRCYWTTAHEDLYIDFSKPVVKHTAR
jgi:hypothetical protein